MCKNFSKKERWFIFSVVCLWLFVMWFATPCLDFRNFTQYWLQYVDENLFTCYDYLGNAVHQVNYPPLYLLFLYVLRKPMLANLAVAPFLSKSFVLLLHILFSWYLYQCKNYKSFAWFWFLNPIFFWISTTTIHVDEVFCMVMLLFLFAIQDKKSLQVCMWFTVACLLKLQGCYLLPVLLVYLWQERNSYKDLLKYLFMALFTAFLVYLPFMIGSHSWTLPFYVYLQGFQANYQLMEIPGNVHGVFTYGSEVLCPVFREVLAYAIYPKISMFLLLGCIFIYFGLSQRELFLSVTVYFYSLFYWTCSQDIRYVTYSMMLFGYLLFVQKRQEVLPLLYLNIATFFLYFFCKGLAYNFPGDIADKLIIEIFILTLFVMIWIYTTYRYVKFIKYVKKSQIC